MNPVEVGFFSLSGGPLDGDEDAYLRWHLLDHQPEQYSIPGIRLATRWRADDRCLADRWVATPPLAPVRHAVAYLMTEPVDATLSAFARLGRRTAEAGRFPVATSSHLLGAYHLVHGYAAPRILVSAAAVPFRPHRGILLLVERADGDEVDTWVRWHHAEHVPALLGHDGVAGAYTFRSSTRLGVGPDQAARYGMPRWDPGDRFVTVVYLDGDLHPTAAALEPTVRDRWARGGVEPELAGPFRSTVTYEAWPPP